MAEAKEQKQPKEKEHSKRSAHDEHLAETLVRIYGNDIPGQKQVYVGLTYIKGVSWSIANAMCLHLNLTRTTKVSDLTKTQVDAIEAFLQKPTLYPFLKNYRRDFETGQSKHLLTNELDMTREFDIKRMKQIKSYKGIPTLIQTTCTRSANS
jgi:small subunit ribosomal protein S13